MQLRFEIEVQKRISCIIIGAKPSPIGIGSPGRVPLFLNNAIVRIEPTRIRIAEKVAVRAPKLIKEYEVSIE